MLSSETDVIILCGGRGTRLGSALGALPKPMAPVGNRPFLELLIDRVEARGFRRFILCVGHGATTIRAHFERSVGREIVFSEERTPLGTGGALKLCEGLRRSRTSLVMNGDSLCDFDPAPLLDFHTRVEALATLATVATKSRADGDFVELDARGAVTRFSEHAPLTGSGALNAGIYALGSAFWSEIPSDRSCSLEKETFPALVGRGLFAWPTTAALHDIGTAERLEAFRRSQLGFKSSA